MLKHVYSFDVNFICFISDLLRNAGITKKSAIILKSEKFPGLKDRVEGNIDIWWVVSILFV